MFGLLSVWLLIGCGPSACCVWLRYYGCVRLIVGIVVAFVWGVGCFRCVLVCLLRAVCFDCWFVIGLVLAVC